MGQQLITVITWKYLDGSGAGVVGVYETEELADEVMILLDEHGSVDKKFEKKTLPLKKE